MLERSEPILKGVCWVLAAALLFQISHALFRRDPLSHLAIPALPTLPLETNAPAATAGTGSMPPGLGKGVTNVARSGAQVAGSGTNGIAGKTGTNLASSMPAGQKGTNTAKVLVEDEIAAKHSGTNASGTNINGKAAAGIAKRMSGGGMPPGMAMMGMGGPGAKAPELPLPVQARVFRITDSEILGPVMRPLPTALLGIVGEVAFVRSASGQSGMVKEGESVGALKLLQIGTNRVLVEEDGQKKELTIFSGYGSESLMPKQKDNSQ